MPLLFHAFSIAKHWYVFDANKNSIISVNEDQHNALSEIEQGIETRENLSILHEFQEKGFCREAIIESIYNPNTDLIGAHLEKKIQNVIIQVTQGCNLRCAYCAYSGRYQNRTHSPKRMSFETAKRAIDMALSHSEDTQFIIFSFYGGEPLLELPLIKRCVKYIKQQAPNRDIIFSMTTNGTLLTPDVYGYLSDNGFNIVISLDGPKQIHDMSRKYPDGRGSYDIIMENIKAIKSQYPESRDKLRFNAVLSPEIDDSCLPTLFKSDDVLSYYNHTANSVSDAYTEEHTSYSDAFSLCYDRELCKLLLFKLGKLEKEHVSVLFGIREADIRREYGRLKKIPRISPICHPGGPCLAGAMRLFVNVDGKLFPCERVSENSQLMAIGDLDNGFDIEKVQTVMNPGQVTDEQCKKCWVINHCSLCAAFSDDLTGLSQKVRLSNCPKSRSRYEETLKTICFLKEAGYDFEN
ncbi:Cys-rich peptide radical SAM maturase CcpM [Lachnoclostridium phytofermentans]|uniref:Radical SAM domain protein n=1 Tax=Lachnoclostridium phytofermentans (strain ATCC 700394 / DSM 18823 / ISDg) TaxID=357809 RepID=A9KNC1_LACP7|nr:Cys-rich peptide radical SAM maturase CcpM [Lachnoclostridium phytofermentans]ABX43038.1 Radical SAM domain protein [Lachnoclostridium phytofermentans ISDg]